MLRALIVPVFFSLTALTPASAANWLEMGTYLTGPRYDGDLPSCEAGLGTIASNFGHKESAFWQSGVTILDFENVRQTAFRSWASDTIPRRFCTGVVNMSDGRRTRVHYWIGETVGFAGASWGVEWCVVGYDRNWAYNPACRMARP